MKINLKIVLGNGIVDSSAMPFSYPADQDMVICEAYDALELRQYKLLDNHCFDLVRCAAAEKKPSIRERLADAKRERSLRFVRGLHSRSFLSTAPKGDVFQIEMKDFYLKIV